MAQTMSFTFIWSLCYNELDYKSEIYRTVPSLPVAGRKRNCNKKCFDALKENGIFITFEKICLENNNADLMAVICWQNYMRSNGKTQQEVKRHTERRGTEVFPITLADHFDLLKKTGFKCVELLWFSYMQAGFFAIK